LLYNAWFGTAQALKSKNPSYCGPVVNAVSVILGQQPGPAGATTSGVSNTVHNLFTGIGIARNKQKYQKLLADFAAKHPEQYDAKLFGRNDVSSLSFDNLEFMMK